MGARSHVRADARAERRRAALQLRRRPGDREQVARRPHRLGAHAEGRLPALQGAARLPSALPERLRLPGPLDRGRRRARARPQLEAGDRGVRPRRVRAKCRDEGRLVGGRADEGLRSASASGWTGGGTTSPSRTRTSSTSGGSSSSSTSAAGCTSATARPSGARAAGRRCRSTSCHRPASTRTGPTRRSTFGSR